MPDSPQRLLQGIAVALTEEVAPHVDDPFARMQCKAAAELLANLADELDWAQAPLQRRNDELRAILDALRRSGWSGPSPTAAQGQAATKAGAEGQAAAQAGAQGQAAAQAGAQGQAATQAGAESQAAAQAGAEATRAALLTELREAMQWLAGEPPEAALEVDELLRADLESQVAALRRGMFR